MDITIHFDTTRGGDRGGFVGRNERSLSNKHRMGHKPAQMSQTMSIINFPDAINKRWKNMLKSKLSTRFFRHDLRATVYADHWKFELSGRNTENFVNNLANLILRMRHQDRDRLGVATKASVLAGALK